jgi:hypothetical protein
VGWIAAFLTTREDELVAALLELGLAEAVVGLLSAMCSVSGGSEVT